MDKLDLICSALGDVRNECIILLGELKDEAGSRFSCSWKGNIKIDRV